MGTQGATCCGVGDDPGRRLEPRLSLARRVGGSERPAHCRSSSETRLMALAIRSIPAVWMTFSVPFASLSTTSPAIEPSRRSNNASSCFRARLRLAVAYLSGFNSGGSAFANSGSLGLGFLAFPPIEPRIRASSGVQGGLRLARLAAFGTRRIWGSQARLATEKRAYRAGRRQGLPVYVKTPRLRPGRMGGGEFSRRLACPCR